VKLVKWFAFVVDFVFKNNKKEKIKCVKPAAVAQAKRKKRSQKRNPRKRNSSDAVVKSYQ
jgi:hypothetical protein